MDHKTAKELLYKSVNHILNKIILKNYKGYEIINKETRILIDFNYVYRDIKKYLNQIIDNIADRFRIIDKDFLTKKIIIQIYKNNIRECILKINKFIVNTDAEKNENIIKYLINQINKCFFTDEIIIEIKELSEVKKFNIFEYIKNNWKILLIILLVLIFILLIKKGYDFIFRA